MYRQYCLLPAPKHILKMIILKFVVPVSDWRCVTRPNETTLSGVIKFSTSDNAILAFSLVHCISVTSDYTYV